MDVQFDALNIRPVPRQRCERHHQKYAVKVPCWLSCGLDFETADNEIAPLPRNRLGLRGGVRFLFFSKTTPNKVGLWLKA